MMNQMIPSILALAALTMAQACAQRPTASNNTRELAKVGPDVSDLFKGPAWAVVSGKELSGYDALYAMSDVHGSMKRMLRLLKSAKLVSSDSTPDSFKWIGKKSLLVVVGDSINKGPDSAKVLLRFNELTESARAAGGRVIVLLGNHEAEFLADPKACSKEFLESAEGIKSLQIGNKMSCKDLGKGQLAEIMKAMPVGAIVGDWLFVHSGYITSRPSGESDSDFRARAVKVFERINLLHANGDYYGLDDPKESILATHDWWKKKHNDQREALELLGFGGMVGGHEPSLLDAPGVIAISQKGWFIKLDAGMNVVADDSEGRLMRCEIADILPDAKSGKLRMADDKNRAVCKQMGPNTGLKPIENSGKD